jgi:uncharacterized repeat protein (TIGR03803 family)
MQVSNSIWKFPPVVTCGWARILAAFLLCAAAASAASAQTFVILHYFGGPDGSHPLSPLVQGFDGKLYGTTYAGGTTFGTCLNGGGCGTVFKIGRYGAFTTLYNFCSQTNCGDGAYPNGLAEGAYGSFYGVATGGSQPRPSIRGTAFRFISGAPEATLYTFCAVANCADGLFPNSLIEGWDGSFHGTTAGGGGGVGGLSANGTVYRLTAGGKLTTTHTFCLQSKCPDGSLPQNLIQGADGNFYGVTASGGNQTTVNGTGAGTVFRISPSGFSTLYRFCAATPCVDGAAPTQLIQAAEGDLYGVTTLGGAITSNAPDGSGTVFKVTTAGTLTTLHAFCTQTGCPDGQRPSSLIQGSDGSFYGTAEGENANTGPVFRITPEGTFTVLYNLLSYQGEPLTLTQGTDGAFYGTTWGGGKTGRGGIFRLDIGLGPFVHPVLTFGKVGARVTILGTALTDTTAVHFNGTEATFTVGSSGTAITTTVPASATSGPVTVTTATGTLTSNVPFTVLP